MAVYDLRLTTEQFYDLTPRQFGLLCERHNYASQHRELLHGLTTSAVVNFAMSAPKKPTKPQDFMPSMFGKAMKEVPRRVSDKQVAEQCRSLFGALAKASQR